MNMMPVKKMQTLFRILLAVFLVLPLASCKQERNRDNKPDTSAVFCTTYPAWLIARDLMAGTDRRAELLIPADTGCPHDFSLTTSDLLKLAGIKNLLLLRNGGGLDDQTARSVRSANEKFQDVPAVTGGSPEQHHVHGEHCCHTQDPHIFTAPGTLKIMAVRFADALAEFDPVNAAVYRANKKKILAHLNDLSAQIHGIGNGTKIIAMHNTFRNLAEEAGFQLRAVVFDGHISSLSPAELSKLIALIRQEKIAFLLTEPQVPEQIAGQLRAETGIRILMLDPSASGKTDVPEGHLTDVIRKNIEKLKEGMAQ